MEYFCVFLKGIRKKVMEKVVLQFFVNTQNFLCLSMNINIYLKARAPGTWQCQDFVENLTLNTHRNQDLILGTRTNPFLGSFHLGVTAPRAPDGTPRAPGVTPRAPDGTPSALKSSFPFGIGGIGGLEQI